MRASRIDERTQGSCSHGCEAFLNCLPHTRLLPSEAKGPGGAVWEEVEVLDQLAFITRRGRQSGRER